MTKTPALSSPAPTSPIAELSLEGWREVVSAITAANVTRSLSEAPTLTLTAWDPDRALLRSKVLNGPLRIEMLDRPWRLVGVSKNESEVTCTFEDETAWLLRQSTSYRTVARKKMTRVEFVQLLVAETPAVKLVAPEASGLPPAPSKTPKPTATGFPAKVKLTVKGVPATPTQVGIMATVLEVGVNLNAPPIVLIAAMETIIVEHDVSNAPGGGGGSEGAFQQIPGDGWHGLFNLREAAREFYSAAPTYPGGAIAYAKAHPTATAGEIAQGIQGSAHPDRYQLWIAEATHAVDSYRGAPSTTTGLISTPKRVLADKYEFRRGQPGAPESTWECAGRLAREVGWVRFVIGDEMWFVSEQWLYAGVPVLSVREFEGGVGYIDFDYDTGKPTGRATLSVVAASFEAQVGTTLDVDDQGPGSGPWLVDSYSHDLSGAEATVELKRPSPELKEPPRVYVTVKQPQSRLPPGANVLGPPNAGPAPTNAGPSGLGLYQNPFRLMKGGAYNGHDHGVDWNGSGPITAMGPAIILAIYLNRGWPNYGSKTGGNVVTYRFTEGAAKGLEVYLAEAIVPVVTAGQKVDSTTVIANLPLPQYPWLEMGWALPGKDYYYPADRNTSPYGVNMQRFLRAIGAPVPAIAQNGGLPANWPKGW